MVQVDWVQPTHADQEDPAVTRLYPHTCYFFACQLAACMVAADGRLELMVIGHLPREILQSGQWSLVSQIPFMGTTIHNLIELGPATGDA